MLKHGILGLLNYGDRTGYEIRAVFRDSLNHFWQAQTSQIYRELQVLEKNGWISSTHVQQESRPDKNVLSITKAGKEELMRWLEEGEEECSVRNHMLMKTFFRGECSIDENIEYFKEISSRENVFPEGSESAEKISGEYQKTLDDPLKALYWKFTIDFGVMYEKMIRQWCEHCIAELEEIKGEKGKHRL